jgi:hypothetical protein
VQEVTVDPNQEPIFEATPTAADIAAARPLRSTPEEHLVDPDAVTVREARRQAEILADHNAQRARAASDPVVQWQRRRAERAGTLEQERQRRDQGLDRDLSADFRLDLAREQAVDAGPEIGLGFD